MTATAKIKSAKKNGNLTTKRVNQIIADIISSRNNGRHNCGGAPVGKSGKDAIKTKIMSIVASVGGLDS